MSTAFAHSGAILDDRMTGFSQVVNQLDEGSAGTKKDVVLCDSKAMTLDAEDHHGKEIRVVKGDDEVTITLPTTWTEGFKCKVVQAVKNSGGSFSVAVTRGDSDSKFCGLVNADSIGSSATTIQSASSAEPFEAVYDIEAVYDHADSVQKKKYFVVGTTKASFSSS